jgi:hypothetical protein
MFKGVFTPSILTILLGLPIGGAIGLTLFFALGLSTSLHLIGFAESFLGSFGFEDSLLGRRLIGTIACVTITAITFKSTSLALRIRYLVLAAIALSPISLFAATLSSALGSILGAPRYLQALALDGAVPGFLGKGCGPLNEPRVGTLVTFVGAGATLERA